MKKNIRKTNDSISGNDNIAEDKSNDVNAESDGIVDANANQRFFRKFKDWGVFYKIGAIFLIFTILLIGNFAFVKYYQGIENKAAKVILDVAGRNRMLSQRIAVLCERLIKGDEASKEKLKETLELYGKSLTVLKKGGEAPELATNILIPPASESILPSINEAEKLWVQYKKNAETIIKASNVRKAIEFIGVNYSEMLKRNNDLVTAYGKYYAEEETDSRVTNVIIDVAGRNGMLSQRIGLIAQRMFGGKIAEEEELRNAINLHHESLLVLKEGGIPPDIGTGIKIPSTPVIVMPTLLKAEELWLPYKENAEIILDNPQSLKALAFVERNYLKMLEKNKTLVNVYIKELDKFEEKNDAELNNILLLILIFNIIVIIGGVWIVWSYVVKPINNVTKASEIVSTGDLSQSIDYESMDEVGKVAKSINKLIRQLKRAADFAKNIGEGKFDSDFKTVSEKDTLGISLTNMRDKLHDVAEEDKKRNWANKGLAKFGEILRSETNDIKKLSDNIISNLVKYIGANQGSLYLINGEDTDKSKSESYLELKACYAWDRKKHLELKIELGQGLAGRSWQEAETIYLTDVPDNYINITSGLGKANPTSILIVPLKINEEVHGIIEIASFNQYKLHEIEFIEKLAESIASTISGVKTNLKTQDLLKESQQMTEEMKSQEEEMRQNMEEMQGTQEEMKKINAEFEGQLSIINVAALVSKTDKKGIITYVNDIFCDVAGYTREELIGKNHNIVRHPDTSKEIFKDMWETIGRGKIWNGKIKNKKKDGGFYWVDATIGPVLGEDGKPKEYIAVRNDITQLTQQLSQEKEITSTLEKTMAKEVELSMQVEQLKQELKNKKININN